MSEPGHRADRVTLPEGFSSVPGFCTTRAEDAMAGYECTGFYMHGMDFVCIWLGLPKLSQICVYLFAVTFLYLPIFVKVCYCQCHNVRLYKSLGMRGCTRYTVRYKAER